MIAIYITPLQYILSIVSGFLVGLSLGMIGGGGSILAVPLLLYFVGLAYDAHTKSAANLIDHIVIGTTALAVGLNAYINSIMHFAKRNVKLKKGVVFTLPGVIGSFLGAYIGHLVNGSSLLFLFGILMIIVAYLMLRRRESKNTVKEEGCNVRYLLLVPTGLAVGFLSGFFGIGGGFLIVPSLMAAGAMEITNAVGTSLIAVGTFGIVSASTYALYNEIDVYISLLYLVGGVVGGYIGTKIAVSINKDRLRLIYAVVIILVAIYLMYKNLSGLGFIHP